MELIKEEIKLKTLKAYECLIPTWDDYSQGYRFNYPVISHSRSAAKYATWQYLIGEDMIEGKYFEFQKYIKIRTIGDIKPELYFNDPDDFKRMIVYRDIEFAYQGMVVDVAGKKGWITSNVGFNLGVMFEGSTYPHSNCHPHHEVTYFNADGEIVKDFKNKK